MNSPFDFAQQNVGDLSLLPPEIQARLMGAPPTPPFPGAGAGMAIPPVQETTPMLAPHDRPGGSFMDRLALALASNPPQQATRSEGAFGQNFVAGLASGFAAPRVQDIAQRQEQQRAASEAAKTLNAHRWSTYEKQNSERIKFLQSQSLEATKLKAAEANSSPAAIKTRAQASREGSLAAEAAAGTGDIAPTLSPDALDQAAILYGQTGQMIPAGMGKSGVAFRAAVANRWGEIATGKGRPMGEANSNIPSNKASFAADTQAQRLLQSNLDAVTAFKGTALANAKLALDKIKNVPDTGIPVFNALVRGAKQKLFGDKDVAAFNTAMAVVQPEFGRILANPTLSGELSDAARKDIKSVVDGSFTKAQLASAFGVLSIDAENRRANYQAQLDAIKGRVRGAIQGQRGPGGVRLNLVPPAPAGGVQWTRDANGNPVPGGH